MKLARIAFILSFPAILFSPASASQLFDPLSHVLKPVLTYRCMSGNQVWKSRKLYEIPSEYNNAVFINLNGNPTFPKNMSIIESIQSSMTKFRLNTKKNNSLFFLIPAFQFYHFVLKDQGSETLRDLHKDIGFIGLNDDIVSSKKSNTLQITDLSSDKILFYRDGCLHASFPYSRSKHSEPGSDTLLASLVRDAFVGRKIPESMPTITHHKSVEGEIGLHFNKLPEGTYKHSTTATSLIIPELVFGKEKFAVKRRTPSGSFVIDYFTRPKVEKKD